MIEHGIFTTAAEIWIHFHPLERAVYWYHVPAMRRFLENRPDKTAGSSKDGTVTGNGYLVPKSALFINRQHIERRFRPHVDTFGPDRMTDREAGYRGEKFVRMLLSNGDLNLPHWRVALVDTIDGQRRDGVDYTVSSAGGWTIEVKTERVRSANLFVQCAEYGHRVHQLNAGGDVSERVTSLPPLRAVRGGEVD